MNSENTLTVLFRHNRWANLKLPGNLRRFNQ